MTETRWVSLAHPLEDGLPRARASWPCSFTPHDTPVTDGVVGRITEIAMTSHIGTHLDVPIHLFPNAQTLDDYPPERFLGTAVVFSLLADGPVEIGVEAVRAADPGLRPGEMALISFGYAEKFGTPEYGLHPYLSLEAARYFVERGASLVGFDVVTPDMPVALRPDGFGFPVHVELLGNDVLIVENLGPQLGSFARQRVEIIMTPLPIRGGDGSPVVPLVRSITSAQTQGARQ
ncbi:cyclase family protein [Rhodococcus sp. 14-2483-1-2]|uniref:cyclase family protein n=1 Tax=Rhodococcus sp. 14-2483-1-2 TaxID=2023147 RepID=UPI000B9BF457|nr:cyclase family protein [Rhodococcus sp. 14-2483-1-2]OZF26067.1 hypothetical protein CH295_25900 [Rhodococcus sp. 14-2483-1-2]